MREFDILRHVFSKNRKLGNQVLVPPGDDLALITLGSRELLIGVDQLVDRRHFNSQTTPLHLIGRKAITRSLSDIAAMAGRPVGSLAAVTLPPEFGDPNARALFDSMHETAAQYNCPLIGGDIAVHSDQSQKMVCSVTVIAEPVNGRVITRSGAQIGDTVYVTGRLGGSLDQNGGGRHLTFEPRIDEALQLTEVLGDRLHAMIDVSDGLGRDTSHIAEMSNVAIQIDADAVPCSPGCDWCHALSDGEDYELCFTAVGAVPNMLGATPVTAVGDVIEAKSDHGARVVIREGALIHTGDEMGWQHES